MSGIFDRMLVMLERMIPLTPVMMGHCPTPRASRKIREDGLRQMFSNTSHTGDH
jgi:hypothetical protein